MKSWVVFFLGGCPPFTPCLWGKRRVLGGLTSTRFEMFGAWKKSTPWSPAECEETFIEQPGWPHQVSLKQKSSSYCWWLMVEIQLTTLDVCFPKFLRLFHWRNNLPNSTGFSRRISGCHQHLTGSPIRRIRIFDSVVGNYELFWSKPGFSYSKIAPQL